MHRNYLSHSSHSKRFTDDEMDYKPREEREPRVHYRAPSHHNHRPQHSHQQRVHAASESPVRDEFVEKSRYPPMPDDYEPVDTEVILRLKWMDNSARMQRLREHRQKRLVNKLEQFELWDMEQEQKQKQYDIAREQRYNSIVERLKSQDFCVNLMKKRHESDMETTRDLEPYCNDHLYVDPLDDPQTQYQGPISQYRKFQAEMDHKMQMLHNDIDTLNPRNRIEQTILPRLVRTRELYSMEPEVFTRTGKRVLKKPNLRNTDLNETLNKNYNKQPPINYYNKPKTTKPIIIINNNFDKSTTTRKFNQHNFGNAATTTTQNDRAKSVYFNDDIEYSNGSSKLFI